MHQGLVSQSFFNGKQFFRVLDGFVAQTNGNSNLGNFANEIVPSLTFNSPGLLSFANAGAGTNNSQIFITAINNEGSNDPISLAREPQFLNGNFTILRPVGKRLRHFREDDDHPRAKQLHVPRRGEQPG